MSDLKRSHPEPPAGPPQVQWKRGLADELMTELAPLLAEDGIDINDLEATDLQTLQAAMNRAVERRNMALFTPVGPAREIAAATLRLVVEAILDDDTTLAAALLEQGAGRRDFDTLDSELLATVYVPGRHLLVN